MSPETRIPEPENRSDKIVRYAALMLAAFTLVWLSGCGEPVDVDAVQQAKQQAKADVQAAWEAKLNEGPTPIVPEDYWRVEPKDKVGAMRGATSQTLLRTKGNLHLWNLQDQFKKHCMAEGRWPKNQEEFMELVVGKWGMPMPRLKEPYEVWYNAETHEILKRPKPDASKTPVEESPPSKKP